MTNLTDERYYVNKFTLLPFGLGTLEGQPARRLTAFEGRDVWDFDVSRDGRTAVMVVWDTLYTLELLPYLMEDFHAWHRRAGHERAPEGGWRCC